MSEPVRPWSLADLPRRREAARRSGEAAKRLAALMRRTYEAAGLIPQSGAPSE